MQYQFAELVDIEKFRRMMDLFYQATRIPYGLVDPQNNILSAVGWQLACSGFHRAHPVSEARCLESNQRIVQGLLDNQCSGSKCLNGMMDYASPVVIEGEHVATVFLGQILHEPPDLDFFRKQAQQFGYDEAAYLKAITEVPVVPRKQVESIMQFCIELAGTMAQSGLDHLRQKQADLRMEQINQELAQRVAERTQDLEQLNRELAQDLIERQKVEAALRDSRAHLMGLTDSSPTAIGWSHLDGRVEYINRKFTEIFGYEMADIPTVEDWYAKAYPEPVYRKKVIDPWISRVQEARSTGQKPPDLEARVTCKNGDVRWVEITLSWVGERRLVNFVDITERWLAEQRNLARNHVLEMLAKGAPLENILHALVAEMQQEAPETICSILLVDRDGRHLLQGAAPDLPDFYNEAIHGLEVGPGVGSCGTAVYTRQRVIVEDIQTHPYWQPYKALAAQAGLAACWSEPVLSSTGRVLGTFAIYHRKPRAPKKGDMDKIAYAANLASIAIEHCQVREELERQAHQDYLTGLANRRYFLEQAERELTRFLRYGGTLSLIMFDIDYFKRVNDTYGHKTGDMVLQELSRVCRNVLRDVDICGRIGGEEFAVVLPQADSVEAVEVAERLRASVASTSVAFDDGCGLQFTISIGVTTLTQPSDSIGILLNQADEALYEAKGLGRNQVRVYHAD